jgi:beta-galactosidase
MRGRVRLPKEFGNRALAVIWLDSARWFPLPMKIPLVCVLGSLALACSAPAEGGDAAAAMFPRSDLMTIGVYYYPEAWPQAQWPRDIANIKKLHLEFVHMGEFAWAFMEPQEGKFDFTWLDKAVQLCADQGLKVVLCTPSPTPPVWLEEAHPEIHMVDAHGRSMVHGAREQATWSSDTYPRPSFARGSRTSMGPSMS